MTQHLDLDGSPTPQPEQQMPMFGFGSLQTMLQLQIMSKMQTGNPLVDGLMYAIFTSLIPVVVTTVTSWGKWLFTTMWRYINMFVLRIWRIYKGSDKYFNKTVEISYITDNKSINELYKAVHWYLSNAEEIDFAKETPLKMTFEKKITNNTELNFDVEGIQKFVTNNMRKTVKFKNYVINYKLSNELIKIYSDKERQRENYKIELSTELEKDTKSDIIEEFCKFCVVEYKKSLTSTTWKQMVYVNNGSSWKAEASNNKRNIDTVILQGGLKDEIKGDIQVFLDSEDWYHARDIPYTRGYLFYGPPGTGKTSTIKGLSLMCQRHIHYLTLSNVNSDVELLDLFKNVDFSKTVMVIEDIDCMEKIVKDRNMQIDEKEKEIKLREKIEEEYKDIDKPSYKSNEYGLSNSASVGPKKESRLTLSGILNAIDGIFTADGRILIITSNKPEILDSALLRTGRIDMKYLFDYCTKDQIKGLYEMFFDEECDEDLVGSIDDRMYSPSDITGVFVRFRNNPREALKNLDSIETKVQYKPVVKKYVNMLEDDAVTNKTKQEDI